MTAKVGEKSVTVTAASTLTAINGKVAETPVKMTVEYIFENDEVSFKLHFDNADGVRYILPIIGDISLETENSSSKHRIFYLSGGFIANEYTFEPDEKGDISVKLSKMSTNC